LILRIANERELCCRGLCELKSDGNVRCYVYRATVDSGWAESDLLRYSNCFLIETVAQTAKHTVNKNLAACRESDAEYHAALDFQLARLGGI
jgi:hypothetical protein